MIGVRLEPPLKESCGTLVVASFALQDRPSLPTSTATGHRRLLMRLLKSFQGLTRGCFRLQLDVLSAAITSALAWQMAGVRAPAQGRLHTLTVLLHALAV